MARGDKSKYTDKQKRMAKDIEEGYEHRGTSEGEAKRRAWATVNKQTGGGKKGGSGSKSNRSKSGKSSSSSKASTKSSTSKASISKSTKSKPRSKTSTTKKKSTK